jgi:hypothetical protein
MHVKSMRIGLIVIVIALLLGNLVLSVEAAKCHGSTPNECNGHCVNLQSDKKNCGDCGNVCGNGEVCHKGTCISSEQPVNSTQVGSQSNGQSKFSGPISIVGKGSTLNPIRPVNIAPPAESISPTYNFVLDSLKITNTRAVHEDTDYANWGVAVNDVMVPGSPLTKSLGNLNNGVHPINLAIGPISVPNDPNTPVTITLQVVNSGHTDHSEIVNTLSAGAGVLIGKAINEGAGAATGAALKYLGGILTADCDGPVAVDKIITNGQELAGISVNQPYTLTTYYPGTDSATGCGSNSQYFVTWHVEKVSDGENAAPGGQGLSAIDRGSVNIPTGPSNASSHMELAIGGLGAEGDSCTIDLPDGLKEPGTVKGTQCCSVLHTDKCYDIQKSNGQSTSTGQISTVGKGSTQIPVRPIRTAP